MHSILSDHWVVYSVLLLEISEYSKVHVFGGKIYIHLLQSIFLGGRKR